jgi:hypothetical protein
MEVKTIMVQEVALAAGMDREVQSTVLGTTPRVKCVKESVHLVVNCRSWSPSFNNGVASGNGQYSRERNPGRGIGIGVHIQYILYIEREIPISDF